MKKFNIKEIPWSLVGSVALAIVTGIIGAIDDHKKETELKQMKEDMAMLKQKVKDS